MAINDKGSWSLNDGEADNNAPHVGSGQVEGQRRSIGLYSMDTTGEPATFVGKRRAYPDGRVFRYAHYVSAVGVGKLAAQDFSVTGTVSINGKFTADEATGQTQISLTDTDTFGTGDAEDVYAGGYLHITDDAGEGYTYRIKSNDVGTSAGVMILNLWDSVEVQINTESSCSITGNMYRNLAIADNGVDDLVAGVAMKTSTADDYGWVQTWGPATVLADESAGTIAAGTIATLSDGVNGAAQPMGGASFNSEDDIALSLVTEPIIGYFMTAATDTEYVAVYLQIAP